MKTFSLPVNHRIVFLLISCAVMVLLSSLACAVTLPTVRLGIDQAETPQQVSTALQILVVITILSVTPSIILMTTCFTRIVIVLGFLRQAMGTQNMPPTQIILGLALFLSFFVMSPTLAKINETALQPYMAEQINQGEALEKATIPIREFMFSQVREPELRLMTELTMDSEPANENAIPTMTLIPAFMLSELKLAFQMGFMIYIPFLVIDMIVASILMSMGMMMLPPVIISMPFKLLLFVLVDGWNLIVGSLIKSFNIF